MRASGLLERRKGRRPRRPYRSIYTHIYFKYIFIYVCQNRYIYIYKLSTGEGELSDCGRGAEDFADGGGVGDGGSYHG